MESEYKRQSGTKSKEQKQLYWDIAIGLNKVDNLTPSKYLISGSKSHIEGELTLKQLEENLKSYYTNSKEKTNSLEYECDIVSKRIVDLLDEPAFSFSIATLNSIHKYLFKDVLEDNIVGKFRNYNITKEEPILNNNTVIYGNHTMLTDTLEYDFKKEKAYKYSYPFIQEDIDSISDFTSSIWQIHPFAEGNTRTIAVFIQLYLNSMGYDLNNELFKNHSKYFRNSLVLSNYSDPKKDVYPNFKYLKKFFNYLLNNTIDPLSDEELICKKLF